jgi:hypothetical protein
MMYGGCPIDWMNMLARYSPMMPREKSVAPEKMETIDARKGNPGILPPLMMYWMITYKKTPKPKSVNKNPMIEAARNGSVLKPVIISMEGSLIF